MRKQIVKKQLRGRDRRLIQQRLAFLEAVEKLRSGINQEFGRQEMANGACSKPTLGLFSLYARASSLVNLLRVGQLTRPEISYPLKEVARIRRKLASKQAGKWRINNNV